jgi:hypothetical protein
MREKVTAMNRRRLTKRKEHVGSERPHNRIQRLVGSKEMGGKRDEKANCAEDDTLVTVQTCQEIKPQKDCRP